MTARKHYHKIAAIAFDHQNWVKSSEAPNIRTLCVRGANPRQLEVIIGLLRAPGFNLDFEIRRGWVRPHEIIVHKPISVKRLDTLLQMFNLQNWKRKSVSLSGVEQPALYFSIAPQNPQTDTPQKPKDAWHLSHTYASFREFLRELIRHAPSVAPEVANNVRFTDRGLIITGEAIDVLEEKIPALASVGAEPAPTARPGTQNPAKSNVKTLTF